MLGMMQFLGYLLAALLVYIGLSGCLRDAARFDRPESGSPTLTALSALAGLGLVITAVWLTMQMDDFARGVSKSVLGVLGR